MNEITVFDVLGVLAFVGTLVIGAILATRRGEPLDDAVTARFDNTTRAEIERLERLYTQTNENNRKALDTVLQLLKTIAPITPLKSDDAVLRLLDDVTTPGAKE